MHHWGDENVDWAGISNAAEFISLGLRKWGRVNVRQHKEKYGLVCVYLSLGLQWWPQLTHPGHVYNRWPRWTWWLQSRPRWLFWLLNLAVMPYHKWLYLEYYRRAVTKWPHLKQDIIRGADIEALLHPLLDPCEGCQLPKSNWSPARKGTCQCREGK